MAREIDVTKIAWPSDPVRGVTSTGKPRTIAQQLDDMTALAKDAKGEWPFPAILIRKLSEDAAAGESKFTHEALDGVHRLTVARRLKRETIPATIVEPENQGDAFAMQVKSNIMRGTDLDRDTRDAAIVKLRTPLKAGGYGMKLSDIAAKVGLTLTSVSRIARGIQRGTGGKTRKAKAKAKTRKPKQTTIDDAIAQSVKSANGFDPATFYVALDSLVHMFSAEAPAILAFRESVNPDLFAHASDMVASLVESAGE